MESMQEIQGFSMLTHVDTDRRYDSPAVRAGFGTTRCIPTYTAVWQLSVIIAPVIIFMTAFPWETGNTTFHVKATQLVLRGGQNKGSTFWIKTTEGTHQEGTNQKQFNYIKHPNIANPALTISHKKNGLQKTAKLSSVFNWLTSLALL